MKLCIAEKPSVAKNIATVLGANTAHQYYYTGNGYCVTWTFGHLCGLKEPHEYRTDWKFWRIENLPMIPDSFGLKLLDNPRYKQQFSIIQKLVSDCDEVINCGDAGQEGELIQRWVLQMAKCKVPVKRLWISSLTEESIKNGFKNLQDSKVYDNLYAAGNARAIGDWVLGINATRLFTLKFGSKKKYTENKLKKDTPPLSIGRVQTPTLAMIVERQKEIDAFKPQDYWELKTTYRQTEFICQIKRLTSAQKAQKGIEYLKKHDFIISSFQRKKGKEKNPRLYDLTALQVEANKLYAYSAQETLNIAQKLYENKLISYPRVDTTYLSEDLHPKIPPILKQLVDYQDLTEPLLKKKIPFTKSIFDNKKISDHHAIIPTGEQQDMSAEESVIYDLICRRFIAVFYPECEISNTIVLGKVGELLFKTTGKQILSPGWRAVYADTTQSKNTKQAPNEAIMPEFVKGERGPHKPTIHKGRTTAPKYYTEGSLLRAMETAGRQVDDEEMRELMKENGIGRPSTRAAIIELLFNRKYIERKGKNIVAMPNGIALIDTIQNDLLKSPELTGQWEKKLRLIEKGKYEITSFTQELFSMIKELTDEVIFNTKSYDFQLEKKDKLLG